MTGSGGGKPKELVIRAVNDVLLPSLPAHLRAIEMLGDEVNARTLFLALDGVRMLLKRTLRDRESVAGLTMWGDGNVTLGDELLLSRDALWGEIRLYAELSAESADSLLAWIFEAARSQPHVIPGFDASPRGTEGLSLTPVPWNAASADLFERWRPVAARATGECAKTGETPGSRVATTSAVASGGNAGGPYQIGTLIPGKGVFLGTWSPKDQDGQSLNKTFNLFAAPYDLGLDENGRGKRLITTFKTTVAAVGNITGLMGFPGFKGQTDKDLYSALRDGSYRGEWFLPTRELLHGRDVEGNAVQADHLFGHKQTGVLAGTFASRGGFGLAHWYWSCSEQRDDASVVRAVNFKDAPSDGWVRKDNFSASSRLVRAELLAL